MRESTEKQQLISLIENADEELIELLSKILLNPADPEPKFSKAILDRLDVRLAKHKIDPQSGSSWNEVRERIKSAN